MTPVTNQAGRGVSFRSRRLPLSRPMSTQTRPSRRPAVSGRPRRPRHRARAVSVRCATCRSSARTATPIRPGSRTTSRSATPPSCCSRRTTTCIACSTARAWRSRVSGSCRRGRPSEARSARGVAAVREPLPPVRGTPSSLWLNHVFAKCSGSRSCSMRSTADHLLRHHRRRACAREAFRPRALFERFNIEVLATTEVAARSARASPRIRDERLARPRDHHLSARTA